MHAPLLVTSRRSLSSPVPSAKRQKGGFCRAPGSPIRNEELRPDLPKRGEILERSYSLDAAFNVLPLEFPQSYVRLHKELESERRLDHKFAEESERKTLMKFKRLVGGENQ